MTLDYYRIFYYVARYKSFSNAAEMLGSNQPNITRCMNILENELDCKLLIRSHKGIQLTTEGEHLFRHVAIAIEQLTYGEKEIIKNKSLESGQINIGISETAMRLYLLDKLQEFHKDYPHVRLKISNHSTPQAIDALEKGLVDIAMVTSPLEIRKPLRKTALRSYHDILIGFPGQAAARASLASASRRISSCALRMKNCCIQATLCGGLTFAISSSPERHAKPRSEKPSAGHGSLEPTGPPIVFAASCPIHEPSSCPPASLPPPTSSPAAGSSPSPPRSPRSR